MNTIESRRTGDAKQLLADEVFHHIGQRIVDGALAPGDRIRDVAVADELHVSRTPVREALQRLERLGLVTMYPSRYTEVTPVSPETVASTREFAGYQAGVSARMGVPRLTETERAAAVQLVDGLDDALPSGAQTSERRWELFSYLGARSNNPRHGAIIDDASFAIFRNLRDWVVPADDHERMRGIHAELRDAVQHGDGDAAERLARLMYYV